MADHAFKTIGKDIKERKLKPVVVFYGREQYLVNWAKDLLVSTFVNEVTSQFDYAYFDASTALEDDIISACESFPMLSEKKLVHVKVGLEKIRFSEKSFAEYLSNVPESTILLITFESEEKGKELLKLSKKYASSYDFSSLDERTFKAFVGKRIKAKGKSMQNAALREFTAFSGYFNKESDYTLYNLVNDIEKICAYSAENEISKEDVEAVVSESVEKNVFALVDAVSTNKKGEAFKIMNELLSSGTSFFSIYALLTGQIEIMYMAKQLKSKGMNFPEIVKELKVHEFRVKKALSIADRYREEKLKTMLIDVYEIDSQIKSGLLEDSLAMELFIASM